MSQPQNENIEIPLNEEEVQEDKYSYYSEGDQYDSDEGPVDDKKDIDRRPFKQIQIDYQHFQPVSLLPQQALSANEEDIKEKKIQQYQQWLLSQQLKQQTPDLEKLQQVIGDQSEKLDRNEQDDQRKVKEAPLDEQIPNEEVIQNSFKQPAQSTQLTSGYQINQEELAKLIYPWTLHYDQTWKKNYYFNGLTNESAWELPEEIIKVVQDYRRQFEHRVLDFEDRNMYKFLPKSFVYQQRALLQSSREKSMQRPARKQVEESLATKYAYRQGDEEYNIWFDKFLSDGNKYKDRDAALTKCNPETDSGYTKGDLYEKFNSYFCLHFARGCCCEGVNCKFYHRIPTIQECEQIDLSKDIFGRSRYQKHREDMQGVGVFSNDTKSIYITHYKLPKANSQIQALAMMYEVLWRHFGQFGDIDDINILQSKGACFIRFKHRCQAEFAKEALQAQALDEQEILTIKWANEDPNPKAISRDNEEKKIKLLNAQEKNDQRKFKSKPLQGNQKQKVQGKMIKQNFQK